MTPQENGLRRGLVVLDSLRHRHLGMNRSLLLAAPHLRSAGIALTFVGARSALHAARDLLQAGPRRFDFLLLNSVAAVGPRAPFGYRLWQLLQRRLPAYVY
ncbi:MAG: hypothetical protein KC425_27245, partial [Anaerolineales bacterium]|nr:hypothetical protein [Anaerolineales bacterium]